MWVDHGTFPAVVWQFESADLASLRFELVANMAAFWHKVVRVQGKDSATLSKRSYITWISWLHLSSHSEYICQTSAINLDSDWTVDRPWTDRGTHIVERGKYILARGKDIVARGQGCLILPPKTYGFALASLWITGRLNCQRSERFFKDSRN